MKQTNERLTQFGLSINNYYWGRQQACEVTFYPFKNAQQQFKIFTKTSAILDFHNRKFLTPRLVRKTQMHYYAKFCQNRSKRLGRYGKFFIFQDGGFSPFSNLGNCNGLLALGVPDASPCQISSTSVKWLQRYGDCLIVTTRCYASAVYAVVMCLLCVCLSVCHSLVFIKTAERRSHK